MREDAAAMVRDWEEKCAQDECVARPVSVIPVHSIMLSVLMPVKRKEMPISTTGREDAFRAGNGRVGGGCGVGVKGEWPQRSRELSKWHHGKRRHVHAAGLENLEVRRALGLNCVRIVAPKNENAAGVITHHGTSTRRRTAKNCKRKKKRRPFDAHEFGLVPRAKKLHVPVRVGVVELPDGSRKHVAVAYGAPCRAPLNPCVVKKHNGLEGTLEARRVRRGQSLGNEVGPRPLNVRRVRRRRLQSSSYAVHVDHWVALRGVHATGAAGEV